MPANPLVSGKTPGIIITEIRMMNSSFKGVHFLVEGVNDIQFWKSRVVRSNVSFVDCEGKTNLIGAAALSINLSFKNVIGIYDADLDRHFGITHFPQILAVTDENDLETTLLASSALDSVLNEFADEARIEQFALNTGLSVVKHIQVVSSHFGRLRYLNQVHAYGVDFDRLSPYRFISMEDWQLDINALHAEYVSLAGISGIALSDALSAVCPAPSQWNLSQGHDSIRIVAQGLKGVIGQKQISEQDLGCILRIGFSREMLQASAMYVSLKFIGQTMSVDIF